MEEPLDAHRIHLVGEIHCHMAITAIKQIMLWTLGTWIKVNCTVPLSSLSQWQYC